MNKITVNVALEVASHESLIREAYKDSVGVWTWSIGLTNATGHNVERYINNPQPLKKCLEVFVWALGNYADDVTKALGDNLPEHVFAAALSFHWNTGAIERASWVAKYKYGNMNEARHSFMLWNKPSEIIPRRHKEAELLFDGTWSNDGRITEYKINDSHKPIWSTAKKIDIRPTLQALLEPETMPKPPAEADNEVLLAKMTQDFVKMCAELRDKDPERAREFTHAMTRAEEALLWARHGLKT